MDMLSDHTSRPSGISSTLRFILLSSGILLLLCAVALPLLERHKGARAEAEAGEASQAVFELLRDAQRRCMLSVDKAAARLTGVTGREPSLKILLEYAGMYPEANFTLYGPLSEPLISVGPVGPGRNPADGAPTPSAQAAAAVAAKVPADAGYVGLTVLNDSLGLCAARSVAGSGRVLVVSLPLNDETVHRLERIVGAEIGIRPTAAHAAGKTSGSLALAPVNDNSDMPLVSGTSNPHVITLRLNEDSRSVGVQPLNNSLGETEAYLYVAPATVAPASADDWWSRPELPYLFALCGFLGLFLWYRSKRQALCETVAIGLKEAIDAERAALPEPPASLPPALRSTLEVVTETLVTRKDLARQAVVRLTEKKSEQAIDCVGPVSRERTIAGRHYDNAVNGIYQCTMGGALLRINLSFALMLGYESSLHLQSEHRNISELFVDPEEAPSLLADLREEPHARLPVLFRLRDGSAHPFWLTCFPRTGDENEPMEGFLIDRAPEIALERAQWERDQAVERGASLAKLLAATCLQTQAYFAPRPADACERRERQEPAAPGKERRRGINSLKDIFDDIYRVAVSAAEDAVPAMVPIDVYGMMDRVYRQALPAMAAKSIDLTLDVEPGITTKVSGSDSLLRHTLLRCLFMITAPVSGGSATLGISRDPYTASQPGTLRLVFSASWVPNMDLPSEQAPESECPTPANPAADRAMTAPAAMSPLERRDEQAVIEYLVGRMNGQLLGSAVSHNARAVQFVVQLDTGDTVAQQPDRPAPAGRPTDTPVQEEHHFSLSGLMDEEETHLPHGELAPEEVAPTILFDEHPADEEPLEDGDAAPGLDILLVDDSPNTRMLFSLYLKGTRHRITEAHDGREGVEAFGGKSFDVVFMDLEMPLMDGYQATRIIRAMEADAGKKPVPIVAVTGYTLPEARHECFAAGCTEFLAKPFSKNALLSMLEAIGQAIQKGA